LINFGVTIKKIDMHFFSKGLILFLIALSISSLNTLSAQDTLRLPKKQKNRDILNRIDIGGYLGAQFGSVTIIDIAPTASYRITEKLYAGLGLTYMYYKDNRYVPAFSLSSYGGSIFTGYYIWRDLFVHLEYAPLYIPDYYDYYMPVTPTPGEKSPWAHDIYIGAGYRQWIGDRASVNMMILWNVNESIYSPYRNPIIRIGFGVGL